MSAEQAPPCSTPCIRQREVTIRKSGRLARIPEKVVFDHFHEAAAMWPRSEQSVARSADDDVFGELDSHDDGESRESFRRRDRRLACGRITPGMIVHTPNLCSTLERKRGEERQRV